MFNQFLFDTMFNQFFCCYKCLINFSLHSYYALKIELKK